MFKGTKIEEAEKFANYVLDDFPKELSKEERVTYTLLIALGYAQGEKSVAKKLRKGLAEIFK